MFLHILLAVIGSAIAGAAFAYATNALSVSRGRSLFWGQTKKQGTSAGAMGGVISLCVGVLLNQLVTIFGFAVPLGLVGSTAFGSLAVWFALTVLLPGNNAGLKWSMAGFGLAFGAACGLGSSLLLLFA